MEVRQARELLAVAEHTSFSRAGHVLAMSAATLSQSIRRLERQTGVLLFHRTGQSLVLTSAGKALIGPARRLVRAHQVALDEVAETVRPLTGHVEIGTVHMLNNALVPQVMRRFHETYPTMSASVREFETDALVEADVSTGRLEVGLVNLDPVSGFSDLAPSACGHCIGGDEMVLVVPREVAATLPDEIPWDRLPALTAIGAVEGSRARHAVEAAMNAAHVRPKLEIVTTHRAMVHALVSAGMGMYWDAKSLVDRSTFTGIEAVRVGRGVPVTWVLVHGTTTLSTAALAFCGIVLDISREQTTSAQPSAPGHTCGLSGSGRL